MGSTLPPRSRELCPLNSFVWSFSQRGQQRLLETNRPDQWRFWDSAHLNIQLFPPPPSQVKCPGQTNLQGTTTPGAQCTRPRTGATRHPQPMASRASVLPSPPPPTRPGQTPPCTQDTPPAHTQDSPTPPAPQEMATPVILPCHLSSRRPFRQMSWAQVCLSALHCTNVRRVQMTLSSDGCYCLGSRELERFHWRVSQ